MTTRTKTIVAPDREIKLSIPISGPAGCAPGPTGLFWFSDSTGTFSEIAEAAYVLPIPIDPETPTDTVSATLGVARVLGETCGEVIWTAVWTPDDETGGAPGWREDGPELQVYPLPDTAPGVLSVTAQCAKRTFGPITLTLALLECGCCPDPVLLPPLTAPWQFQDSGGLIPEFYVVSWTDCLPEAPGADNIHVDWSLQYIGERPGEWQFVPYGKQTGLLIRPWYMGADESAIVTADVQYRCTSDDAVHQKTLERQVVYEPG